MDALPTCAFNVPPNWALITLAALCIRRWAWAGLAVLLELALLVATYLHTVIREGPRGVLAFTAVCLLAVLPAMLQDVRRLCSKLWRCRFMQTLQQFDWMDGKEDHVPATQLALLIKGAAWVLSVCAYECPMLRPAVAAGIIVLWTGWAYSQGRVMPPAQAHCTRPLQLESRATPFVVLASQRTGSNMLCGLLHGVRGVHMHNEIFNDKGVFSHGKALSTDVFERDADPEAFLLKALAVVDTGAVGFKLFPEHIRRSRVHDDLLKRVLTDPRVKKIVLVRDNRLAVAVSRLRAATTGAYVHTQLGDVQVLIEPAELQMAIDSYDAYYQFLRQATAGQHVLHLSYE